MGAKSCWSERSPKRIFAAFAIMMLLEHSGANATTGDLPTPALLTVISVTPQKQLDDVTMAARTYAAFWNTGYAAFAEAALSDAFIDRTLPQGRPQGKTGPIEASKGLRAAVPDLKAAMEELIVAGDRAVVRLSFTGHFIGTFGELRGKGEPISFRAIDIYRVQDGKILENWHLEDNLTLMQQLGAVKQP